MKYFFPLKYLAFSFLLFICGCASQSFVSSDIKKGSLQTYTSGGGSEVLPYKVLVINPEKTDGKYPLLIVLHGTGMDGSQYLNQWKEEALKHHFMAAAPLRQRGYKNEEENLKGLYQMIEEIKSRYPVDPDRIHLAGVSSGALIARWLMVRHPEMWRSVVFIASEPFEDWPANAPIEKLPPILYVHGMKDEAYPFHKIQERVQGLRQLKVRSVRLMSDPEAGHEHPPKWNAQIFEWMTEQD